jgi:hypothetical protein
MQPKCQFRDFDRCRVDVNAVDVVAQDAAMRSARIRRKAEIRKAPDPQAGSTMRIDLRRST